MTKWIDFKLLKQQLSFQQVLAHYGIKATKDGEAHVKACCPFHDDKRPSLGIDLNRKIWQCFACKTSGNVLDFITRMEGHDPVAPGAIRKGAEIAVEIMSVDLQAHKAAKGVRKDQVRAKPVQSEAAEPPPVPSQEQEGIETDDSLENEPLSFELKLEKSHAYMKAKGFKPSTYEAFGIGYCKRGMMKGRVCFPLRRADGELVGYAGRWAENKAPDDQPRWLYPPKFNPDCFLFNWFRLAPNPPEHVVICGNYWDVLASHERGIAAIGVPQFELTETHVETLALAGVTHVELVADDPSCIPELAISLLSQTVFVRSGRIGETREEEAA